MFLLKNVVFLAVIGGFQLGILSTNAKDSCSSHFECDFNEVCCKSILSPPLIRANTEFHCRKSLQSTSLTRSCFGFYCTTDSDCRGRKDGNKLCCQPDITGTGSRCAPCPRCTKNSDCGQFRSCCHRSWSQPSKCDYTCIGESCKQNSHCAVDECCRLGRCVKCSDLGCSSHSECPTGQYCCFKFNHWNRTCKINCIGEVCGYDGDCALLESCKTNKCVKVKCNSDTDCNSGTYCCKNNWYEPGLCLQSCVGKCIDNSDCSQTGECCRNGRCTRCTCQTPWDCFNNERCCKVASLANENKCMLECDKESCIKDTDCVNYGMQCVGGICSHTKQCNDTSDCSISADPKSWEFPSWLFGVFVGILVLVVLCAYIYYFRKKMQQLNTEQSSENVTHGRIQNTCHDSQNETQINASQQELIHYTPSSFTSESDINNRDNANISLPSYSDFNTDRTGHHNIPPPPYSFDDGTVSPECNIEPPPRYRVIQL